MPLTVGGAKLLGTHVCFLCMAVCLFESLCACICLLAFCFVVVSMFQCLGDTLRAKSMERHFERKRYTLSATCCNKFVLQEMRAKVKERYNLRGIS